MLMELSIRNFAIIEELSVSFEEGLTVLTGETGAGKSIIIDAIGLLIGGRGSVDFVRHGSRRAEIEGLFSVDGPMSPETEALFQDLDIQLNEEDTIVLKREITHQGKSVCRINGRLTTLGILRQAGQQLVDIHGQHEHQQLLQTEKHQLFLDRFAEEELHEAKEQYEELFHLFEKKRRQLLQVTDNEQQVAQRLDLISYQFEEIQAAGLQPKEDESLEEERRLLANSEGLYKHVHGAYDTLYGDGKGLEWVMAAMNQIEEAAELDPSLQEVKETITSNYYLLEETAFSLRDYYEAIEFDPDRLNEIEARLSEIHQLKRKYGESVEQILEYAAGIEEELDTLTNREQRMDQWQKELEEAAEDLYVEAENISRIRRKAAGSLKEAIQQQLQDLYMPNTIFEVDVRPPEKPDFQADTLVKKHPFTKTGMDHVEFLVATNRGEPLKSLAKIASGGEISRMILALKSILAANEGITSLIFDEVDTGVSGRVAQSIAEKIHGLASGSQVLCITHLPQVAAMADTHLFISKEEKKERTITQVNPLPAEKQTEEIARMISGVEMTELTLEHARELIQQAAAKK
ncbi:DNA repair protein RecN [Alkalicoccus urumqiensis]|uniref:DNA repair protein RecN n=1 Tax=Alkalicoccus urumqiensis TaxID=1548213 RepID=A0A2P6MKC2_ALKUR|nr:DNA repair protein RecN [Alkalicoccus urumqiensis]PRO66718.1 DNA repair protein RecN [Alkalicoccus urumqiensis]